MEPDDMTLVREFAASQSEPAFARLVARHLDFVYSSALRRTGDAALAEEVAQGVFIVLARKAGKLGAGTVLTGWLYRATQFVATTALRQVRRREQREQEAYMQSVLNPPEADETWKQIAPVLEAALDKLNARDRDAVLLRFFQDKTLAEVGRTLGVSEDGARVRVNRALEKLRQLFAKRGVDSTADAITGAISANSIQVAPVALAKSVTAVAIAKGGAATTSTLTIVKGALKIMAWTKAKTAIVVGMGVLLAAGTATVTVKEIHERQNDEWQLGEVSSKFLLNPPYRTVILPTKSAKRSSKNGTGGMAWIADGRILGINAPIEEMARSAYSDHDVVRRYRTILNGEVPTNKYDFFSNLPTGSKESLKGEIKRKFGVVGRFETIETNVLFLMVKYPNAAGLKPSVSRNSSNSEGNGMISMANANMDALAQALENSSKIPVINQTGLTNDFDFKINWNSHVKLTGDSDHPNLDELKQALTKQLGLELVPGTAPIEMLVVEKVK